MLWRLYASADATALILNSAAYITLMFAKVTGCIDLVLQMHPAWNSGAGRNGPVLLRQIWLVQGTRSPQMRCLSTSA